MADPAAGISFPAALFSMPPNACPVGELTNDPTALPAFEIRSPRKRSSSASLLTSSSSDASSISCASLKTLPPCGYSKVSISRPICVRSMSCMFFPPLIFRLHSEYNNGAVAAHPSPAAALSGRDPAQKTRRAQARRFHRRSLRRRCRIGIRRRFQRILHRLAREPDELLARLELAILLAQAFQFEPQSLS